MTIFDQSFFDELHNVSRDPRKLMRRRTVHAEKGIDRFDADARSTNIACAILAALSLFLATVIYESVTHPPANAAGTMDFFGP